MIGNHSLRCLSWSLSCSYVQIEIILGQTLNTLLTLNLPAIYYELLTLFLDTYISKIQNCIRFDKFQNVLYKFIFRCLCRVINRCIAKTQKWRILKVYSIFNKIGEALFGYFRELTCQVHLAQNYRVLLRFPFMRYR